jgi:outer membrane receptor protein involved in Fe transport
MLGRCRIPSIAFFLSSVLAIICSIPVAQADVKTHFELPAEPLAKALRDFATQAKRNIFYEPSVVRGLSAPAINGDFATVDVLALLLKGTRLRAVNVSGDTIEVFDGATSTHLDSSSPSVVRISYANAEGPAPTSSVASAESSSPNTANATTPEGKELEEITVTGTNLRGVDNKTVPLLTFDRDAIDRSGYATTQDFIDSLPQNFKSGANSADGVLTGNGLGNIENSTAANLRGLGSGSTLTLLNGHRVAASAYGSGVDLSMIPLSAVERIEVLTDGSSAVYGADAVGGVINIILRKDFNGQETSARLDTLTQGGGEQKQIGQSLGRTWNSGGALAVVQFEDSNAIHSDERTITENSPQPTDIYPSNKRYSGVFSGHQTLPNSVETFADVLAEHNDTFRALTAGGSSANTQLLKNKTDSQSVNAGLRWQPFGDWHLEGGALFSQVNTLSIVQFSPTQSGYTNGTPYLRNLDTIKEGDIKLDGTLWSSGGSSIKAAAGASYRREDFSSLISYTDTDRPVGRHVRAAFAEFYAPLISSANAMPGLQKLELSAAVRHDSYSDFGAKTNPRFAVFWSPIGPLGLRAAYSTSFRAPNPTEVIAAESANYVFVAPGYPLPNGTIGNVLVFGNQTLGPETSRNLTAGLDFTPQSLPGTRLSLNYYRIIYANRIIDSPISQNVFINPQIYGPLIKSFPSDAAVAAFVAGLEPPQTLIDFTPTGTGLAGVRYGFPYGDINATTEKTEGLDLGVHSIVSMAGNHKLIFDLNSTYIRELATTFCNSCTSTDLANTYGQALKFRLRGAAGWSNGILNTNAALNFANAYADTNIVPTGRIGSLTTADINVTWRLPVPSATTLGLSITNVFDANPPRTSPAFNGVSYDPSNSDPRGRTISVLARAQW